jgi:hypothetical protein
MTAIWGLGSKASEAVVSCDRCLKRWSRDTQYLYEHTLWENLHEHWLGVYGCSVQEGLDL